MGLVSVGGEIQWPVPTWLGTGAPARSTSPTLNAVGRKFSFVIQAPETGQIDAFFIRASTVTGTGVQVTGAVEGVDLATGDSNGTDFGGSAPSAGVSVASATGYRLALTTGASVTKGDLIALVVEISAGTTPTLVINVDVWGQTFPYFVSNNGAVAKQAARPIISLEYATGYVYTPNVNPLTDPYTTSTYNSGSGTNRRALKITSPFGGRVSGFWAHASLGGDADMNLRDSANTVLATRSMDKDVNAQVIGYREYSFVAPVAVAVNDVLRLSLEPSSGTNISTYEYTFPTGLYTGSNPVNLLQGGTDAVLSTWNGSAWTDSSSARPMMGLLFDQIYDSGSGGGIFTQRGLGAGLN